MIRRNQPREVLKESIIKLFGDKELKEYDHNKEDIEEAIGLKDGNLKDLHNILIDLYNVHSSASAVVSEIEKIIDELEDPVRARFIRAFSTNTLLYLARVSKDNDMISKKKK